VAHLELHACDSLSKPAKVCARVPSGTFANGFRPGLSPKSGCQVRVPSPGAKSGRQVRAPSLGAKSGRQVWTPSLGAYQNVADNRDFDHDMDLGSFMHCLRSMWRSACWVQRAKPAQSALPSSWLMSRQNDLSEATQKKFRSSANAQKFHNHIKLR